MWQRRRGAVLLSDMFSDAPITGPYAPSCASRCVDGMARGVIIGVAWTAAFGEDVAMVVSAEKAGASSEESLRGSASFAGRCRGFGALAGRNSLAFAGFLGAFSGASCWLEKLRERDDFVNKLFGGLAAGAVAAAGTGSPRQMAISAGYTGLISGFVFFLFSPARVQEDVD